MIDDFVYDYGTILPTNDLIFKRIFWNKEHPDILISFINSVLKRTDPISSVELISTEMDDEFIVEHGIRLDLVAKTSNNEILNIEMQKKNDDDMYKRSLYYWSKLYSSQLRKGQRYKDLRPVITINILDFTLFDDNRCHRNFILKDAKSNEEGLKMLDMHFIELKKRKYMDQNDDLWAWAEFLKAPNSETLREKTDKMRPIVDAKEIFDRTIADPIQQEKIRLLLKTQLDNQSSIAKAKEDAKIETAKNFLKMGLTIEQVATGTGLTVDEVKLLM